MWKNQKDVNIVMTGGHAATTGIAVIEEIRKRYPEAKIEWIGPKYETSGSKTLSIGYKIYPSLGVKYLVINAGKLQTKFTRYTLLHLILIPVGFIQALFLVLKETPLLVVSFGGFSSFPVIFWSFIFRIPVILHEQTVSAGRASIASSIFATKIVLAREESLKYFSSTKSLVIGNPIMSSLGSVSSVKGEPNTILVMGGSRGSEFINEEISKVKPEIISKYKIIHITGERDYGKYKKEETENYQVLPFVSPREMYKYYEVADLVIGRSGANSVAELLVVKRPAILIPLPRTFMDEQIKNAVFAEKVGVVKIMKETEVNPESLVKEINKIFANWKNVSERLSNVKSPDAHASEKFVDLLSQFLPK